MPASLVSKTSNSITIQIEIPLSNSMLEGESFVQDALNKAGASPATSVGQALFQREGLRGGVVKNYQ